MKEYPSISKVIPSGIHWYGYKKLDGSNIRAEWSRKHRAFTKFGSRTVLIDKTTPILGEAVTLVQERYQDLLNEIFMQERLTKAMAFFEFLGPNSFAGEHQVSDPKEVLLIDLNFHPSGIVFPKEYEKLTKHLPKAPLIHQGPLTQAIIDQVKNGTFPGMSEEGILLKANTGTPGLPLMAKLKSDLWLAKLREKCKGDESLFNRLA